MDKAFSQTLMAMTLTIMLVFSLLFASGCAMLGEDEKKYALDTSYLSVEVSIFKRQYERIEDIIRAKQASENMFTDEEWSKLLNVDTSIDMVLLKIESLLRLQYDDISIIEVQSMYTLTKEAYRQAYEVMAAHWTDFTPSTQLMLQALDDSAKDIDTRVVKLMENPTNENITQTITLITGILGLATKILAITVI